MKFGVRECCDVVLKAKATQKIGCHTFRKGDPVIYFDTVKTSTVEGAATTVYAQGGRGNARLLAWEGERTLTFTMEDALISLKGLAILTGAGLITAGAKKDGGTGTNVVHAHTTAQVVATAASSSNDDPTPTAGQVVVNKAFSSDENATAYIMKLDENGEMSGIPVKCKKQEESANKIDVGPVSSPTYAVSADGKSTTITSTLIKPGDVIFVDFYVDYEQDATEVNITPDKFGGYYYLEASTLFRRESDGYDLPAEFVIPKCKIQSNFSFTLASSGDPTTFTFTIDAFPDYTAFNKTEKVLCALQILEADDNYDLSSSADKLEDQYARIVYNDDTDGVYMARAIKNDAGNYEIEYQTENDADDNELLKK